MIYSNFLKTFVLATGLFYLSNAAPQGRGRGSPDSYDSGMGAGDYPIPEGYTVPLTLEGSKLLLSLCSAINNPPLIGSNVTIVAPTSNLTLKYITLARGTVNYTCSPDVVNSTDAPELLGTNLTLYDVAPLLPYLASEDDLHHFPAILVNMTEQAVAEFLNLPVLGYQYFPKIHYAITDLGSHGYMEGKADADYQIITADGNPRGPDGSVALSWIREYASAGTPSWGVSQTYRVYTAGGEPGLGISCEEFGETAEFDVQVAAEHWFYG
ncbi:MAG: hypothetical protein M1834_007464 [Cirrosporium novae-zelandiae]|nr:MAG: hypothetical protein M1834_007464 [Cirrosporium novae-zelandiae]